MSEHQIGSLRPSPPESYEGYQWMAEPEGDEWSWGGAGKTCRRKGCKRQAVAQLRRSNGPWAYCADHLYGRWIEGGYVMGWRLRRRVDAYEQQSVEPTK